MPLNEPGFRGEPVVAATVGARGTDTYGLPAAIGRDCIGALQFIAGDEEVVNEIGEIKGEIVGDEAIDELLRSLPQAPPGLGRDDEFRVSVAGAQEKAALLRRDEKWIRPHGTTPTTHLLKTQIGELPNGIDLSNSVENEFHCLQLVEAFGLPV